MIWRIIGIVAVFRFLLLLPIGGLLVWSLFQPMLAGSVYLAIMLLFAGYCYFVEWAARCRIMTDPSLPEWERACLREHAVFLRYPSGGSRILSTFLNLMRWSSLLFAPWLFWNKLWIIGGAMLLCFFPLGIISVRLDPLLFYGIEIRRGRERFLREYEFLVQTLRNRGIM